MDNRSVGDIVSFSFGKYEVTDVVRASRLSFEMERNRGKCPHCNRNIVDTKKVKLKDIFVLKGVEKDKGRKAMVATCYPDSPGTPGLIVRLPDKEFMPDQGAEMAEKVKKQIAKKGK